MATSKTFAVLAVVVGFASGSWATEYDNDDDDRSGHVPVVAHELVVLGPEEVDPALARADLEYIAGMVPHHEGAVTMSRDYLADPRGTNPLLRKLARAIRSTGSSSHTPANATMRPGSSRLLASVPIRRSSSWRYRGLLAALPVR